MFFKIKLDAVVKYDRVLMNPPFENLQDIDHVLHALHFLKPGGRLVAVMSPSPFFRSDRKCELFRGVVEKLGCEVVDLPDGSFKASGTGVATKLLILDKD
jgi:type I restriction-modification system DNA methylase subunit